MSRRLTWFGHPLVLSPETLAETFFTYCMSAARRPCRPKTIWLSTVMSYHEINIGLTGNNAEDLQLYKSDKLIEICSYSKKMKIAIGSIMFSKRSNM